MSSRTEYGVVVKQDIMVPMRDGVHLATDIYHPAVNGELLDGKLPTLLERTPYGKRNSGWFAQRAAGFTRRGYVVAVQDCRGCDDSEGEFYTRIHEPHDGHDTVEWIARQSWSNGQVATFGTSYMSQAQMALATQNPPHLSCMFPNMGGWKGYNMTHKGGAFEMYTINWAFTHAALNSNKNLKKDPKVDKALNSIDIRDWWTRLPYKRGHSPLSVVPSYERYLFDFFTHADYDDYWKQPAFAWDEYLQQFSDVPIHLCGGWYDQYTGHTLEAFVSLTEAKKSHVRVIIGPWTHGTYTPELSYAGDIDFGGDAALASFDELHMRWFDRWMRNDDNGIDREPPIRLFIMGGGSGCKNRDGRLDHGGRWRNEQEWPLARTRYTNFYLHDGGSLSTSPQDEENSRTSYLSDPHDPVPTIGGNGGSMGYLKPPPPNIDPYTIPRSLRGEPVTPLGGGFDQVAGPQFWGCKPPYLPLSSRSDVLVFQSEPLKENVEVTGPIVVKLWASSSAPDTDFTAKLIDIYPPNDDYPEGYALNLTDSILRARYRNSFEHAELMEPGVVYELTVNPVPTSNLFKKGHRIRLDIASSNFPRFDVNPNTGEPLNFHTRTIVAENTIYHDKEHPSHIILPIIPV